MKKIELASLVVALIIAGCQKQSAELPGKLAKLSNADSIASTQMLTQLTLMSASLKNLLNTSDLAEQQNWDSLYHQQDSAFWYHHNSYNHESYSHDDHSHQWVPYDINITHTYHFHHEFPNHSNDSLVTHANNHLNNINGPHFNGHQIEQHYTIDSLHNIHNGVHPKLHAGCS